jgi:hypothetical protein
MSKAKVDFPEPETRARNPGDRDQTIPRDLDLDVLQVVLPGAPDADETWGNGIPILFNERK